MIKIKFIALTIVGLVLISFQDCLGMEDRFTASHYPKAELNHIEEHEEFRPFGILPIEIRVYIFKKELKLILRNNPIFTPVTGIKEFLNIISLVSKDWNDIASYLGWNNKLYDANTEPKYKIMVKTLWVPQEMIDLEGLELRLLLHAVLSDEFLRKLKEDILTQIAPDCACDELFKGACHAERSSKILHVIEAFSNKQESDKARIVARLLIAGINPDSELVNGIKLLMFAIRSPALHTLIPLLLLKGAKINSLDSTKNTALMLAVPYPKILSMLLDYDSAGIDVQNDENYSALGQAIMALNIESVEILLKHNASTDNAMKCLKIRNSSWNSEIEVNKLNEIAELLNKHTMNS